MVLRAGGSSPTAKATSAIAAASRRRRSAAPGAISFLAKRAQSQTRRASHFNSTPSELEQHLSLSSSHCRCDLKNQCCSEYEQCVSCCLSPHYNPGEQMLQQFRAADRCAIPASSSSLQPFSGEFISGKGLHPRRFQSSAKGRCRLSPTPLCEVVVDSCWFSKSQRSNNSQDIN